MTKELEALERIRYHENFGCNRYFEEELNLIEKALKALKIIKDTRLNVRVFLEKCLYVDYDFYVKHNENIMFGMTKRLLTQEEYDLLKEVLL